MSITIRKFDSNNVQINRAFIIIGKKGSGKTSVMFTLLHDLHKRVDYAMAMCGTRDGLQRFRSILPANVVYPSFNQDAFRNIVQTLDRCSKVPDYSKVTAIVLDDLAYGKAAFKTEEMRMALMNGRWLGIFLILTQQYLMDITPDLRGNFDYIFAMAESTRKTRQKLYEMYFGIFNTFADFERVFSQVTSKRGRALVFDTTSPSNVIQDRVFYYDSVVDLPGFQLGNSRFREHLVNIRTEEHHRDSSENEVGVVV